MIIRVLSYENLIFRQFFSMDWFSTVAVMGILFDAANCRVALSRLPGSFLNPQRGRYPCLFSQILPLVLF